MSGYPGNNRPPPNHSTYPGQNHQQNQYAPPPQQFYGGNQYAPPPQQQGWDNGQRNNQGNQFAPPPPMNSSNQSNQQFQPGFAPPQGNQYAPPPPQQYGNGHGARKAVCIGINYVGSRNALAGCHNDAINMSKYLVSQQGYRMENIVMLMDTPGVGYNSSSYPSRNNMIQAMQWLVRDAHPGDVLFFHYSGHGGQTKDLDGDEVSGMDDTILPADFSNAGEILNDDLHTIMVRPLQRGVRLTAIFDSCHSASSMELPYVYSTSGTVKEPNLAKQAGSLGLKAITSYARGDYGGVFSSLKKFGGHAMNDQDITAQNKINKTSPADVISFSGCKDDQTSADASDGVNPAGAMSWALLKVLHQYPQISYNQLLNGIRNELAAKNFTQKPQLSCSHELDCNLLFVM